MCHFQQQVQSESCLRGVCKLSHYVLLRSVGGDSKATSVASVQFSVHATRIACSCTAAVNCFAAKVLASVRLYNVNEEKS